MSIFGRLKRSIFGDSAETKPGLLADERLAARKTFAQWAGDEAKPNLSAGERLAAQQHQVADDGVVTDTRTGLMWMHCPLGQTWDGTTCIGHAQAFSWGQAMALRHSFAGYDDWRLPSIDELKSIVDKPTDFPRSIGGSTYWSSSPDPSSSKRSPFSMRENGSECRDYPERAYRVRLVRDAQSLGTVKNNAITAPAQALPASTQAESHKDVPSNIIVSPIREEASGNFIIRNNGTVTDIRTGLMWMRCVMGQTWDGATCVRDGKSQKYNWNEAMTLRHSFAGHDDWRLPSIDELKSVFAAFDTKVFPDCLINPVPEFWSSSLDDSSSNHSPLSMSLGCTCRDYPERAFRVRLVRGGQSLGTVKNNATTAPAQALPASTQAESHKDESTNIMDSPIREEASGNFIIRNNGTVTDIRTGLMWMRCALGNFISTWNGATCTSSGKENFTWDQAMALSHSFAGYDDWRLPSIDELKSIVDKTQMPPAIDTIAFPNASDSIFWSCSPDAGHPNYAVVAWSLGFGFGYASVNHRSEKYKVRLVRGRQALGILNDDAISKAKAMTHNELSEKASEIATNRPRCWEQALFAQVITDEIERQQGLASTLPLSTMAGADSVVFQIDSTVTFHDFVAWYKLKLIELLEPINSFVKLLDAGNQDNQDAFGPIGQPGDPEKIAQLGIRAGEQYANAVLFLNEARVHHWNCSQGYAFRVYNPMVVKVHDYLIAEGSAVVRFYEAFGPEILRRIQDATLKVQSGEALKLDLSFNFKFGDFNLDGEIERINREADSSPVKDVPASIQLMFRSSKTL